MRMNTNIPSSADPRYSKRLAIVVSYRDRVEHLAKFVPHLAAYWGWRPEDLEMSKRLKLRGYKLERRDGTFIPLPHKHAGYSAPHVLNDVARRTNALFAKREPNFETLIEQDGISTLKYRLVEKKPLALPTTPALPNVFHYIVDLGEPEPGAV